MRNKRGSAVLLMLVFMALLMTCAIANSLALHHLQAELKLVNHHQLEKYSPVKK